jgi:catechol 2,3-dioxygenase-like lactoylglutathione lyase family enzyme
MKRMHIHIAVDNLFENINFYSAIFGTAPTVEQKDYAKWQLDDPAVNFAISAQGRKSGINHLGIQVNSDEELQELVQRFDKAEISYSSQENTTCCYANSDKHWVLDPQGNPWESFHTLSDAPIFGEEAKLDNDADDCCIPLYSKQDKSSKEACCIPNEKSTSSCCS